MKFQTEHETSYWHDFRSRYNAKDFEHFIDEIVMPNSSLANIALFTFFPDIEISIKNYPVRKKLNELLTHISDDDRKELNELMNKEDGIIGDHLYFLNKMFGVVKAIILNKSKFPKIPLETIFVYNSYHQIRRLKSDTGITKEIELIGVHFPVFEDTFETLSHGKNIERIVHLNFIESMPDLKKQWNEWENYTVSCYEKFSAYPKKDKMLFGTDPNVSHKTVFYFRGQKLDLPYSKHDGDFIFPIGDRYQPALDGELRRASGFKLFDKNIATSVKAWGLQLQDVIRGAIKTHDSRKGPLPYHVKKELKGFVTARYRKKDHTTTKGDKYCTDDMIDVWSGCGYKRPKDKNTSYCERRKDGLCKWPEAKRKPINELSDSNLDPIKDDLLTDSKIISKEIEIEAKQALCKDSTDWKILKAVFDGCGVFKSGKINCSKTARIVGTYDNDVRRRLAKIIKRGKNSPELIDLLK